ncbi:hypothetical protein [Colwellia sp. BRX9-1]|uniref:hypothetical protein n=1 Tax=Colwellia sp. BRX9-1 TaxID=2759830 RepID=UPI0015F3E544|nr:hypothetical protein [Colwellia sp. BRX9-1]MBA6352954.1 hypothetical protein [Colwellia sp. BRX9-1]
MKKFTTFIARCIILVSTIITTSYANDQITDKQIYQLMDKSGITQSIEGLPLQLQAMGQQMALTAKNPVEHEKFMQVFVSSLNPDVMLNKMTENIRKNVSLAELQPILKWLDSDLASRVVSAELQSTDPKFQQNLMLYMAELQSSPPSPDRTKVIIHYVESSEIVEQGMNLMMAMLENMFEALKITQPENVELATQLDAQLEQMAVNIKPSMEQQMVLTSYFIYRDISNEDLNEYSNFYKQATGKKYLSLMVGAIGDGMNDWGTSLIHQISKDKS